MAKIYIDDEEFDGQFGRTLFAAHYDSADLGEAYATAARIKPGDYDSWYQEWNTTAEAVAAEATASGAAGRNVSARAAWLRASEYYRSAWFFLRAEPGDERFLPAFRASVDCFRQSLVHWPRPPEAVEIPFEGTTLGGYWYHGEGSGPRPLLLIPCGYDSAAELGWVNGAAEATARGYDVLSFEGPGQGSALYEQHLVFRPEFETVLTPVMDWALERPGVDRDRVAMWGRSFGGYLAPRAATAEHRLAALVCDPAQYDFSSRIQAQTGDAYSKLMEGDPDTVAFINSLADDPRRRNYYLARSLTHGLTTVADYLRELNRFSLRGLAGQITASTLVLDAEEDFTSDGQADEMFADLTCPKTRHRFTAAEGAAGHCEGLGQRRAARVVFDWLDTTLGR